MYENIEKYCHVIGFSHHLSRKEKRRSKIINQDHLKKTFSVEPFIFILQLEQPWERPEVSIPDVGELLVKSHTYLSSTFLRVLTMLEALC